MKPRDAAWFKLRRRHLAIYPECRACDSLADPCVHHLTYRGGKRGEKERPGDVMTLCRGCHDDLHRDFAQTGEAPRSKRLHHFTIEWVETRQAQIAAIENPAM